MELKERLAKLRSERGFSLRELREKVEEATGQKIAISYLSSLERVGGAPSVDTLAALAAGYGISVEALLAPVKIHDEQVDRYPEGLLELRTKESLGQDWMDTLTSIQFRGERPESYEEWQLIYWALKSFSVRKEARDGDRPTSGAGDR